MPFFNKLFSTKKDCVTLPENFASANIGSADRNAVAFEADQIRVLLFRECERRGERKLLFDSVAVERFPAKSRCPVSRSNREQNEEIYAELDDEYIYQYKRVEREDVNLFKEMVFGTVAMTYRGPSFKIHAIDTPRCIMCTKVFPAPEQQGSCKDGERHSFGTRENSTSTEATSSNGSLLTVDVQSGDTFVVASHSQQLNSYGSRLSSEPGRNSTSSSTCSSWDLDLSLPPLQRGSSQSLESGSVSRPGSLSSLRQRWLRSISTSLSRLDFEDIYGVCPFPINSTHENHESHDNRTRRHKTRIGLAVLIELTRGHERIMEARLLEHVALLEGMLDRLRCSCIKSAKNKGKGLLARMYRASTRCALWLLRLFVNTTNSSTPLLWHKVLLASSMPRKLRVQTLHRSLHLMCQLLDDVDTKSTNFFLSTLVTAVLTYHLGWVHTVLSSQNQKLGEALCKQYPCNPLWAQLCDLYGALGTPPKVAHTIVVGEAEKTDLINAILKFLTYFIRSGNVERRYNRRSSPERELQTVVNLLEELETSRQTRQRYARSENGSCSLTLGQDLQASGQSKTSKRRSDLSASDGFQGVENAPRVRNVEGKISKLKRSESRLKNLDSSALYPAKSETELSMKYKLFDDEERELSSRPSKTLENSDSYGVKVIVNESLPGKNEKKTEYLQKSVFEGKVEPRDFDDSCLGVKLDSMEPYDDTFLDLVKMRPGDFEGNASKEQDVRFMLGGEDKSFESEIRSPSKCNCQCSFAFPRVPSTLAQLPEGVLRKIIQRNFPESSKSIQSSANTSARQGSPGYCPNCLGGNYAPSYSYEDNKLLLETPTNATEVLRTCGASTSVSNRSVKMNRCNSMEYLMEANGVIELPMPRSKRVVPSPETKSDQEAGLVGSLQIGEFQGGGAVRKTDSCDTGYTWGLVAQGLSKRKKRKRKKKNTEEVEVDSGEESEDEWWDCVREELSAAVNFPVIDQPVAEALCIVADVDSCQVGVLSSNAVSLKRPLPVGMSRLVANMLETFVYVWRKYNSPAHSIAVLEGKLREMWLQSEALAEMLIGAELGDVSIASLSNALDLDAADIPLLLAVATTHSPLVAQRFGLTFA